MSKKKETKVKTPPVHTDSVPPIPQDGKCPQGHYYDVATNSCILDVG
jgi:hypothetical protein